MLEDDPFSFIHIAIVPPTQPEPAAVKADTNDIGDNDDDNDSFEWKSATTPAETSVQTLFRPEPVSIANSKEDDLFAALSSSKSGGAHNRQADIRPQSATEATHSSNPGDDCEDEFSDFVSTGAMPSGSAPLPESTQPPAAGHVNQPPAFDVSFFEAAQPVPTEKRNLDFFGDLMEYNFTNA